MYTCLSKDDKGWRRFIALNRDGDGIFRWYEEVSHPVYREELCELPIFPFIEDGVEVTLAHIFACECDKYGQEP